MDKPFMSMSGNVGQPPVANADSLIKDSDTRSFMADVIEASRQVPVLVDFWAPWCGPCKQLTPALEKIVRDAKGALRLVKINVDENQQLAAQMRIQSIPAVFAFVNGQPVDGFMGALPEAELKKFASRLTGADIGAEIESILNEADTALAAKNYKVAGQIYGDILGADRENLRAIAGLAAPRSATAISTAPAPPWRWCPRPRHPIPPSPAPMPPWSSPPPRSITARSPASRRRSSRTPPTTRPATISPSPSMPRTGARRRSTTFSALSAASATGTTMPPASSWSGFSKPGDRRTN